MNLGKFIKLLVEEIKEKSFIFVKRLDFAVLIAASDIHMPRCPSHRLGPDISFYIYVKVYSKVS